MIQLYWDMGKMIADNQELFEGRNNYVTQLANDLKEEFPDINGFSERNLFYIRRFFIFYSGASLQQLVAVKDLSNTNDSVQQAVAPNEIAKNTGSVQQAVRLKSILFSVPWGHHVLIINKIKEIQEAAFYLQQTIEYNWSRAILTLQIEQDLYKRQGKGITNHSLQGQTGS